MDERKRLHWLDTYKDYAKASGEYASLTEQAVQRRLDTTLATGGYGNQDKRGGIAPQSNRNKGGPGDTQAHRTNVTHVRSEYRSQDKPGGTALDHSRSVYLPLPLPLPLCMNLKGAYFGGGGRRAGAGTGRGECSLSWCGCSLSWCGCSRSRCGCSCCIDSCPSSLPLSVCCWTFSGTRGGPVHSGKGCCADSPDGGMAASVFAHHSSLTANILHVSRYPTYFMFTHCGIDLR